jgi:hypothetical protein
MIKDEPGLECNDRRTVGSLKAAELLATELLKPYARYETKYNARRNQKAWVNVYKRNEDHHYNNAVASYDPTLTIVPSVGELGYW